MMSLTDFNNWRMEVFYLLQEFIESKQTFELSLDQINEDETVKSIGKIPVIKVLSYYKVVQIIGELRSYFSDRKIRIFLRGQKGSYGYLQLPKIFRTPKKNAELVNIIKSFFHFTQNNSPWKILLSKKDEICPIITREAFDTKEKKLENHIQRFQEVNISKFKKKKIPNMLAWEAIMQHYENRTRYIDLVDSIPIALWFASKYNRRNKISIEMVNNDNSYGYIFIYGVLCDKQVAKGVWDGPLQRLINLSEATYPLSLRPHVQSAFSLTQKPIPIYSSQWNRNIPLTYLSSKDYAKFLLCIFRICQKDIIKWICAKTTKNFRFPSFLTKEYLFPSINEDKFPNMLNKLDLFSG